MLPLSSKKLPLAMHDDADRLSRPLFIPSSTVTFSHPIDSAGWAWGRGESEDWGRSNPTRPRPRPPPVGISTQQLSTQLYPRPSPVGTSTQQLSIQLVSSSSGQGGDTIECDLIWHSHEWGAEFVEWRAKGAHPREAVTDSP